MYYYTDYEWSEYLETETEEQYQERIRQEFEDFENDYPSIEELI
jgi:hypothetical protein